MTTFYGTLINAAIYHAERGNAAWAASTDPLRTAALINASEYIDSFSASFPGRPTGGRLQDRYWPATGVEINEEEISDVEIPREIVAATYEAALLILQGVELRPNEIRGGAVKRKRVKGGPVEVETEYMDGASAGTSFRKISDLLSIFTVTPFGGATVELLRV